MAAVAKKPPEEEIDPEHPQYAHGMEAGLTAAGIAATPPATPVGPPVAVAPGMTKQTMAQPSVPSPGGNIANLPRPVSQMLIGGGTALVDANMLATDTQTKPLGGLPRPVGPTPAVGGTQAVLPPKIEPPGSLPRKRNQSAVTQPNPADFFRRQ